LPIFLQLFAQFDLKRNNIIEFGEFVRSLSVFHPKAPLEEKAECERAGVVLHALPTG
jgi:hypothetical protein